MASLNGVTVNPSYNKTLDTLENLGKYVKGKLDEGNDFKKYAADLNPRGAEDEKMTKIGDYLNVELGRRGGTVNFVA